MNKPRAIRNYDKLDEELLLQIKLQYPEGFVRSLIRFPDANGRLTSALPFETEEKYYLIRMTKSEAVDLIDDDDDYDDDGNLLDDAREEYLERLADDDDFEEEEDDED